MGTKFRKDVENSLKRFLKGKAKITLGFVVAFLINGTAGYGVQGGEIKAGTYNEDVNITITTDINAIESMGIAVGKETYTFNGNVNITHNGNNEAIEVSIAGDTTIKIADEKTMTINGEGNTGDGINVYWADNKRSKLDINGGNLVLKLGDTGTAFSNSEADFTINNNSVKVESSYIGMKLRRGSNTNITTGNFSIENSSYGIYMDPYEGEVLSTGTGTNILNINSGNDIDISSVTGALYMTADEFKTITTKNEATLTADNKIKLSGKYGVYSRGNNDIELNSKNIEIIGKEYGIYSKSYDDNSGTQDTETKVNLNADKIILNSKWAICSMKETSTVTLDSLTSEITGNLKAIESGKINLNSSQNTITGDILAENSGIVTIENKNNVIGNINDSRLGNTTSGTVKLNLDNGTWESIGKGSVTEVNLNNSGNIKFTDNASSVDIQNLKGKGNGTFAMNVNSEDKSSGNMIYVQNSEGGTYQIDLQNSDLSKIKVGDKIRFATIGEDAKNNNLEFTVLDVKERGIRDVSFTVGYEDFEKGNTENGTYNDGTNKSGNEYVETNYENGENWYLTREENSVPAPNPDPDTDKPTTDPDESINDIGISIIEMAKANYSSAVYMDNLNKRLGDMSFAEGNSGLWVRMRNDRVGEDKEYRLYNNMAQIGYDKIYNLENGKEHRGIAFDYADGQMEYKNLKGESDIDRYTVSLYDTRVYNNGTYADYTARAGYMTSDFEVYGRETGNQVKGDYDNLVLGVGAEFGKRYSFGETSYFEPQIQLQYTYIDDTDYTTNQDTKVNYDEIHSLIGRAGIRVGHDFYRENSKDNTVYLKFDMNHEFLGDQDVKASDVTGTLNKTYNNDNTWYDIGIGGAKNLTENLYVYADMERQFGEERDNSWQFNLGFRYKFGSLKDFAFNTANLFDFDKSEVKPAGKEMIKNASEIINKKNIKGTLLIEGHTDWTGSEEYNQLLSEKRARAVQEVFEENVTNENIKYETKGYGETKPKADNRTSEGRAENRRVEINYVK